MSGGHFNNYYNLLMLADSIEVEEDCIKWEHWINSGADKEKIDIIKYSMSEIISSLRLNYKKVKALDYFLSGDYGVETYLEALGKINNSK